MRQSFRWAACAGVAFALAACSSTNATDGSSAASSPATEMASSAAASAAAAGTPKNGEQFVVGWSPLSQAQTQGRKAVDDAYKKAIEDAGGKMIYCAPSASGANAGDPALQANCVDQFLSQGADAIVAWAVDANALETSIEKANAEGVPFFLNYSTVPATSGADVQLSLQNPNELAGAAVAQNLVEYLTAKNGSPKGSILQIQGLVTAGDSITRDKYFNDVLAQYPEISVTKKPADWDTSKATTIITDWFSANPDTDGIYFESGTEYSPAAAAALEPLGRYKQTPVGDPNHIWMGGIDGESYELHAIKCGWQDVTSDEGYQVAVPTMGNAVMAFLQSGTSYVAGDTVPVSAPYNTANVTANPDVSGLVLSVNPVTVTVANAGDTGLNGNNQPPPNGLSECES